MKLISCHIEHFGKLCDFTYYFEDDLNMLLAENGWGKSTFAAFLKVMFYGFDGENKRSEEGNERLRFRPWEGGVCGGTVTFRAGKKTYRLHRVFGARKKEDTFRLLDDSTGLACTDYTEAVGEELFGIDRESFCRTVFWSQQDHETAATTLIQAKIGDLCGEQDDLPSYDLAMKQLKREIERLNPERASGQIRRKEEQASVLESDVVRLPLLRHRLEEIAGLERELSAELAKIRAERQEFTVTATSEYPAQSSEDRRITELQDRMNASRDRIRMLQRISRNAAISGHRERDEYLRVQRERRALERANAAALEEHRKGLLAAASASLVIAIIMAVLIVVGTLPALFIPLPAAALAAGLYAFFRARRTDTGAETPELSALRQEEKELKSSLRSLSGRMRRAQEQAHDEQKVLQSLQSEISRVSEESSQTGSVPALSAREISDRLAPSLAQFDIREEKCRRQMQEAAQQAEELRIQISECTDSEDRLLRIREEIAALRNNYDTFVQTAAYLEKARESFTSRYMNPFLRSFRKHYSMLTGESAQSIETDADFGITVLDGGLPRDPSLMSEGTRDLISLCRRMAMIDAMYPGEKPFLVLDDPFSNLDDERVKGGMRFLHNASLEYQILYLTCHKSRI